MSLCSLACPCVCLFVPPSHQPNTHQADLATVRREAWVQLAQEHSLPLPHGLLHHPELQVCFVCGVCVCVEHKQATVCWCGCDMVVEWHGAQQSKGPGMRSWLAMGLWAEQCRLSSCHWVGNGLTVACFLCVALLLLCCCCHAHSHTTYIQTEHAARGCSCASAALGV